MPDTADAYTHRIGRTGRAEQTGEAFTLVTSEDANEVRAVEKVLSYKVERRTVAGFDYTSPAPARDREFEWDPRPVRGAPRGQSTSASATASNAPRTTPVDVRTPPSPRRRVDTPRRPVAAR